MGALVFWVLFRISCFGFRIYEPKNKVFGQALITGKKYATALDPSPHISLVFSIPLSELLPHVPLFHWDDAVNHYPSTISL
jgi:hypothetical protein